MRKLSLLPDSPRVARGREDDPRHVAFPIQQLARSRVHAFQLAFATEAAARLGDAGARVRYEPSFRGLRILGHTEMVLAAPVRALGNWYGADLEVTPPQVRYQIGEVVKEPVMSLAVRAPWRLASAVRNDLLRRDARVDHVTPLHRRVCIVRAQATQAELLGYPAWLDSLTDGAGEVEMWLSHYAPIDREPGPAAA